MRRHAVLLSLLSALAFTDSAGAVLVYRSEASGQVVVANDDGSQRRAVAHGDNPVPSPNGRRVAFTTRGPGYNSDLWLIPTKGGRSRLVLHHVFDSGPIVWSPDDRYLIAGDAPSGGAYVIDLEHRTRRYINGLFQYEGASFSPVGSQFLLDNAFPHGEETRLMTMSTLHSRVLVSGYGAVWGRHGIAYASNSRAVWVRPRPRARARQVFPPHPCDELDPRSPCELVDPIAWSADGRRLLIATGSRLALDAVIVDLATGQTTTLPQTFSAVDALSRDGSTVLGEANGNIIAARIDGPAQILAMNAKHAEWNTRWRRR